MTFSRLFGDSVSSDEREILCDAGLAEAGSREGLGLKRAYAQLPNVRKVKRQVETNRVIRVSFHAGGTFEVDGERAPDFYLAMNQIDAGTRPERPINVEGSVLFAPSFGHEVVGVDVQTSLHAEDPFTYEAYDEPRDLVDAIVLRLDNGDALRFSTSGTAIVLELMGPDGLVRKASWGSLKSAFFNPADVTIDCVTGFASKSGALCFGRKGCRFAEAGCLTLRPMSSSGWAWYRGTAFIRRDKAAFFAMADYLLHPTRKEGVRNFSRREWFAYLARVRQLMSDPRFVAPSGPSVFSGAFADSHDLALLEDVERWSAKALRPDARMRLSFD